MFDNLLQIQKKKQLIHRKAIVVCYTATILVPTHASTASPTERKTLPPILLTKLANLSL